MKYIELKRRALAFVQKDVELHNNLVHLLLSEYSKCSSNYMPPKKFRGLERNSLSLTFSHVLLTPDCINLTAENKKLQRR